MMEWTEMTPESYPEECRIYRRRRRVKSAIQRLKDMLDEMYYEHPTLCAALFALAGVMIGIAGTLSALVMITMNLM